MRISDWSSDVCSSDLFAEGWGLENDISYSESDRTDANMETYLGTGPGANNGAADSLGFSQSGSGQFTSSPPLDYRDINLFGLTDPPGWGCGAGLTPAGLINPPNGRASCRARVFQSV